MLTRPIPLNSTDLETIGFGKVTIEVFEDFQPLESQWRHLEGTGVCSVYQRYDWISNWANNVAEPARMEKRIVFGHHNGSPLFILALGFRHRGPFTIATWLGDSHSNFHMGVYSKSFVQNVRPDDIRNVIKCITDNIGHADILELCCQPVMWQGYTNPLTFLHWQESHNHAFALDISDGLDAALNRKSGARKRKKIRWQQNKLKPVGGATLRIAETEAQVNEFLDVSFSQMAKRFDQAGIWNRFEDEGVGSFMRELATLSLGKQEPELMIYGLEIDGKLRATFAGGVRNGQFSGCFISFGEDEYSYISPGEMIIHLVIQDCVNKGFNTFDLGRGEERYKTSWCDTTIPMFETNIALTKRAFAFSAYERLKNSAKRLVRNNQVLWALAKKVRAKYYGRM